MEKISEFSNMVLDDIITAKSIFEDIEELVYETESKCKGNPSLYDKKCVMKYIAERLDGFDELCPFLYMAYTNMKEKNGDEINVPITN